MFVDNQDNRATVLHDLMRGTRVLMTKKLDGTPRSYIASLETSQLPFDASEAYHFASRIENAILRHEIDDICVIWDCVANDWRSFYWNHLLYVAELVSPDDWNLV